MQRKRIKKTTIVLFVIICTYLLISFGEARNSVEIKDIRYGVYGSRTRVVIEFNTLPKYESHRLSNPARLYVDLKEARLTRKIEPIILNKGLLQKIRIAQFKKDVVRVVLNLSNHKDYRIYPLESAPRLVIDVHAESSNPFFREKKIVVIDPGHGGHDPGAVGPRGLKEKVVTLDIAKRLKRELEEFYNLEVYVTRDKDKYLDLGERTAFANFKKADLFVSIHANASKRRRTSGIETYLLNWTNDDEALRVAARENKISVEKMRKSQTELGMILTSLERESKRDESLKLAHFVQRSLASNLSKKYERMKNLGVKQALFYVLVDAEMPSVLVEVAFISNKREERLLRSKAFRETSAKALASGIYKYILSLPDAPKLAMYQENLPEL
jgi:N-acetylmuramoyl-L-alanine amidase